MCSYFTHKSMPYSFRKGPVFGLLKTHSLYYDTNAVQFRRSLIWNYLPAVVNFSNLLFEFNNEIKNIGSIDYKCFICRDMFHFIL